MPKPINSIRWRINQAASEFGIDDETLSKRIKAAGILAEKDDCFSTSQICKAVFGDMEGERLRKTTEEADAIALSNAKTKGELLDLEDWCRGKEKVLSGVKQIVEDSELSDDKQEQILNAFSNLFTN